MFQNLQYTRRRRMMITIRARRRALLQRLRLSNQEKIKDEDKWTFQKHKTRSTKTLRHFWPYFWAWPLFRLGERQNLGFWTILLQETDIWNDSYQRAKEWAESKKGYRTVGRFIFWHTRWTCQVEIVNKHRLIVWLCIIIFMPFVSISILSWPLTHTRYRNAKRIGRICNAGLSICSI